MIVCSTQIGATFSATARAEPLLTLSRSVPVTFD